MHNDELLIKENKTICDQISLSHFQEIQHYGGLFVLDKQFCISQYSENILSLLNVSVDQLLNQPITAFLTPMCKQENLLAWLSEAKGMFKKCFWQSDINAIPIWIRITKNASHHFIEIEQVIEDADEECLLQDIEQEIIESIRLTTSYENVQALVNEITHKLQRLGDFDRVVIYQFNEDLSGKVVSELLNANMESYQGLTFPATDIPASVRAMYLVMPLRYIPTINYSPVKLIPANSNQSLDLSYINLRTIAPVHKEYLINMGLASSTSIAIVQTNQLWGLIACHHRTDKYISVRFRIMLCLIASTLSNQIFALETIKNLGEEEKIVDIQLRMTQIFAKEKSIMIALERYHAQLLQFVSAQGFSILLENNLIHYGQTPTQAQVYEIIAWLQEKKSAFVPYVTENFSVEFNPAAHFKDKACGLLAIALTALKKNYLLFYRGEKIYQQIWAGNPCKTVIPTASGYSPRDSYKRFIQEVKNHSLPWTPRQIKGASFVQSIIVNKLLQDVMTTQAMFDSLTGLLNRYELENHLSVEINRAKRESSSLAVVLIDLDFFKKINDEYGHQAGDKLLAEFARALKQSFREYDYIYRYGGEEFMIILPGAELVETLNRTKKFSVDFKNKSIIYEGKMLPKISFSAGIAIYPNNGDTAKMLMSKADNALYQAKINGRDQIMSAN